MRFARIAVLALALAHGIACSEANAPAPERALVIAHRGASYSAPEHTIAAYDLALAAGADYLEQDVARTSDGVLVVIHDPTLDRTARGPAADCSGAIRDKTLAQLERCDVGTWFNERFPDRSKPEFAGLRIQTLAQVIDRYKDRAGLYVEIKNPELYPGIEQDLITLIRSSGVQFPAGRRPPLFVQSFSAASLGRLHAIDADIPLIQLMESERSGDIVSALSGISSYAAGIGPISISVDRQLVASAHALCLVVHPYGAGSEGAVQALLAYGVDGIFVDRPEAGRRLIDEFRGESRAGGANC